MPPIFFRLRLPVLVATATAFVVSACESAATRACSSEYGVAQQRVLQVDGKSAASVDGGLAAVEAALAACRSAQRHDEIDYLVKARNELRAQAALIKRRAAKKPRRKLSSAELAHFEKDGDPSCPRGQSYRHEGKLEIRCVGPQLVEMTSLAVKDYFTERGYRVAEEPPATLNVERGAEKYSFVYAKAGEAERPSCVVLIPPQGMPWQEAIARATGKHPDKLEAKGTLTLAQGSLPYEVDEENVIVRIGSCPSGRKPQQ